MQANKEQITTKIIELTAELRKIAITDDEKYDAQELNGLAYYFLNVHCDHEILKTLGW